MTLKYLKHFKILTLLAVPLLFSAPSLVPVPSISNFAPKYFAPPSEKIRSQSFHSPDSDLNLPAFAVLYKKNCFFVTFYRTEIHLWGRRRNCVEAASPWTATRNLWTPTQLTVSAITTMPIRPSSTRTGRSSGSTTLRRGRRLLPYGRQSVVQPPKATEGLPTPSSSPSMLRHSLSFSRGMWFRLHSLYVAPVMSQAKYGCTLKYNQEQTVEHVRLCSNWDLGSDSTFAANHDPIVETWVSLVSM